VLEDLRPFRELAAMVLEIRPADKSKPLTEKPKTTGGETAARVPDYYTNKVAH